VKRTLSDAEREGAEFFEFLGVKSLAEARKLDAQYIMDKALQYKEFWSMIWGTVIDDKFCVGSAYELFWKNKRHLVPVMMGHTSSEFFSVPQANTIDEFKSMAHEMFGENAGEFLSLCGAESGDIEEVKKKASVSGLEYGIRILAQANDETNTGKPIYYYNFDAEIPGWDNPGTFHSVDLWFFFETLAKCWRPFVGKHYDLARQMCNYWSNFIRSGDPNGKDSTGEDMPRWEPYTKQAPYGMLFADKAEFLKEQPSELMSFLVKEYFRKR
jgi:para-nitrobenzyl esterase